MRNRLGVALLLALLAATLLAPASHAAQSRLVMKDVNLGVLRGVETFSITATNRGHERYVFYLIGYGGTGADIDGWVSDPTLVNECYNLSDTRHPPYIDPGESCTAQFRIQPVEGYFGRIELEYCILEVNQDHTCATIRGLSAPS